MKKTKIVCTLGPACDNLETLLKMAECGMDVARLNLSHANHEIHSRNIELIREVNQITKKNIAILFDTRGPEIRTHNFEGGKISFELDDIVRISGEELLGNKERFSVTYQNIFRDIPVGQKILIDDGYLELHVTGKDSTTKELICQAANAHTIKDKRGVNIPGAHIDLEFISEKDRLDMEFACDHDVDFIAPSFVQTVEDIEQIKEILKYKGKFRRIKIIAKIETVRAVENIDAILDACDGVMVARGDLGVEVEAYDVPVIQKHIIQHCQAHGKVSITATQMMESMQQNLRPTRAEVSDVANAVLDGSDAVMLSGETAAGIHPVESVKTMANICERIEQEANYHEFWQNAISNRDNKNLVPYTIASAVCHAAQQVGAKAIVTPSQSGMTPRLVSRFRPHPPIIVITENPKVATILALHYGIYVVLDHFMPEYQALVDTCQKVAQKYLGLKPGDHILLSAGLPIGIAGTTNEMRIVRID